MTFALKLLALLHSRCTPLRWWWASCAVALLAVPARAATYTFKSDTYAWETTGNPITSWQAGSCTQYPGDDDYYVVNFTGGFSFNFAGTSYSGVRVLSNGMLQFGADTGTARVYTNTALPTTLTQPYNACTSATPARLMVAYWTDLNPNGPGGSGTVAWEQKGASPNRYLVVSWNSVYQYNSSTPYSFQVILFENGEFKYQYGSGNASGSDGTIGVQVSTSDYTQYSYNSGYNANGSAIRWFIPSGTPMKLAEYRLDEFGLSGSVGEVADSTGNGYNGVRANAAVNTTASGKVCRALNIPDDQSTASYAVDTALNINSGVGKAGTVSLWVKSNVAWSTGPKAMLFDATMSDNGAFFLTRNSGGSLSFVVADSAGTTLTATTAAQTFTSGNWVHIATTWSLRNGSNQSTLRIYVNGVLAATKPGTTTGLMPASLGTLYLGDNRSGKGPGSISENSANGLLDEVHVYNYEISQADVAADMASTHTCPSAFDHVEAVPASTSGATCSPVSVTVRACANSGCTSLVSNYTGTVNLSTSSGRGDWAASSTSPPNGVLVNGAANDGSASYTFALLDQGDAVLTLSHTLAQNVAVSVVDSGLPSSARTATAIQFRDNVFSFAEDLANKVAGSDIVVAGRPHDVTLSLIKKDPSTGSCGVATDYSGSRALKFWRSDSGGPYTAPTVVSPALSIPSAQPVASNLTLSFTAGVASFSLGTSNVGRYALNALDDSLSYAATSVNGASNTLTVRPFVLLVDGISYGATTNPNGSAATDSVFAPAGANFSATVSAYAWANAMLTNGADTADTGTPVASATATALKAGGKLAGFNSATTLSTVAGSQTPNPGVLGALNNGAIAGAAFSGGSATVSTLQYTEVGSFLLNTTGVVSNYLGSSLALDAVVVNNAGSQNSRIGRFVPAKFVLSGGTVTHRVAAACSTASSFSHLDEAFRLDYTLTAQNTLGNTTSNYTGSYARLDLATAANHNLAGIAGSTVFKTTGTSRLGMGTATGSWANGVASGISLTATALRAGTPDGPHTAIFGVAPMDPDGVSMGTLDLDTDSPANGADHTTVATVPLRFGRLRLMNAMGPQARGLTVLVANQYWNGTAFADNLLDNCTKLQATQLSYGNLRKTLTSADGNMTSASATLVAGRTTLPLAAPGGGRSGTLDVALSLGSTAADASCLQTWNPAKPATTGANMGYLRGAWCSSTYDKDPSARITFGAFRGAENFIYQRENY